MFFKLIIIKLLWKILNLFLKQKLSEKKSFLSIQPTEFPTIYHVVKKFKTLSFSEVNSQHLIRRLSCLLKGTLKAYETSTSNSDYFQPNKLSKTPKYLQKKKILPLTLSIKSFVINPFLLETTHEYFPESFSFTLSSCKELASIPLSKNTFLFLLVVLLLLLLLLFVSFLRKVH